MELIFQQRTVKFDKSPTVNEIIQQINIMLEKGYYFSHFIADEIEVYQEHEAYLSNHEGQINRLEIIGKTVREFVNDLLLSTEEYIDRATPELTELAEGFYDNPRSETWESLNQLLSGIQWLDEMLLLIGKSDAVPTNWKAYLSISSTMQEEIRNLSEAIENKDNVLIGDIIQYEIIPNFEALNSEVKLTIDNEGKRYDLN